MRWILATLGVVGLVDAVYGSDVAQLQSDATQAIARQEFETALTHLNTALESEPDNAYTHYLAALTYLDRKGNLDQAASHLESAVEAGSQPQPVALLRARLYVAKNRVNEAVEEIEQLAQSGYVQYSRINDQPDFDPIRGNARFQTALEQIRAARFPCEADERHHDFDFWLGDWTVYQNGTYAGDNHISSLLDRCLIFEQWKSASGSSGKSFNYYDPAKDHWRQIWVSDSGTIIEFTGQARDGGIFYTAETTDPSNGAATHHRFEFTRHPEGGVRQFWAISNDMEDWTTIWDGHYVHKDAGE